MGSGGDRNLPFIFTGQVPHQQPQRLHQLHLLRTRTILRPKKSASAYPQAFYSVFLLLSHLTSPSLTGFMLSNRKAEPSFAVASNTQHGQTHTPSDPPDPASPGTVCSSPFELCQDPGTSHPCHLGRKQAPPAFGYKTTL